MAEDWHTEKLRKRGCECGALDCRTEIEITMEEEDAADHSGRNLWIVAPGHDLRARAKRWWSHRTSGSQSLRP